jgi:hypothetical protein
MEKMPTYEGHKWSLKKLIPAECALNSGPEHHETGSAFVNFRPQFLRHFRGILNFPLKDLE